MKFTTATALFAISASVASAAPAYNSQVSVSKAATTTTSSVDQPSIILDYYTTTSSASDKTSKIHTRNHDHDYHDSHSHAKTTSKAASAVSILPIGQESTFIPSGISIHTSVPTTIVSSGKTIVSDIESVSFVHFGAGPARISARTSTTGTTSSSTAAAYTSSSTSVTEQLQSESTSSSLPFTLHYGFLSQATAAKSSSSSSTASSSASHSTSSSAIPSYKTTVYSTIYAKPSTISVVAPKSTITSVVSIPGTKRTVTETVHQSSAKPYVSSSSGRESVTHNNYAASSSSVSSLSSSVSLPFTLHFGFPAQHSTLVTSVKSSTTAAPYATSSSASSSKTSGSGFVSLLKQYFTSSSTRSAVESKATVHSGYTSQSAKSTPVVYTVTSYIKATPVAAHTSASSATASPTTKK